MLMKELMMSRERTKHNISQLLLHQHKNKINLIIINNNKQSKIMKDYELKLLFLYIKKLTKLLLYFVVLIFMDRTLNKFISG